MNLRQEDVSNPVESTFSWIWGNENFAKWRGGSSGVFWVLGKPGSGKSTFTKHILEGLNNDRKSGDEPSAAVASFFFNSRGGDLGKSSRGFLQSLLHQIITQIPTLLPNILDEYKSQKARSGKDIRWPLEILFRLLLSSITDPINKSTCIFIDALDECEKSSMVEVRRYLTQLSDVISSSSGNLKLFITTRPEPRLQGIVDMHEKDKKIKIFHKIILQHLNNSDLEVYVKKQMKMFPESRKEYIERELLSRAEGVFLWVVLAINMLEEVVHGASSLEVEEKLNSIPSELDELYIQILNKVPVEYHDEAKTMFEWALLAESPLWLPDFRYAVAISRHKFSSLQEIEESPKVQKLDETKHRIRMVSGGLLEVKFGRVQPIHQSVKDFLLVDKKEMDTKYSYTEFQISKQQGHANLATACILYLQFHDFQLARYLQGLSRQSKTPFLDYAINNWIYHARICDQSDTLYIRTMHQFLWYKSGSLWQNWNELRDFRVGRGLAKLRSSESPIFTLYENRMFRLIARTIADGSYANIPNFYRDALQAAAHFGYENEVTILLGYGADINIQGGIYGSTLQAAVCGGHYETVEFLVANGADVNLEGGTYGSTLQAAVCGGHYEIVEFLVANGADVNLEDGTYGGALAAAAYHGYHDIVKFLVGVGADINGQSDCHGNALQFAAYRGHHGIVQFLVESGADINSQGGDHGSALNAAACNGHIEILHFLVKNGANLNAQGGIHGNSLKAAVNNGHAEVVQFLVENGVNFHVEGSNPKNSLETIVRNRCPGILQFLIKNWADIKGDGCNALQIASNQGSIEITRALVESGADVNAQGGKYGSALHAASSGGHLEVSRFLVDNGANTNAQSNEYGSVLHSAASGGHLEILRFLVDNGANANAQSNKHGSALHSVASGGHLEILRFLVENGADVNARGGTHGNALQAAAYNHLEVSRFLIQCGANVNAQGGLCGDALHASLAGGDMEIVQLLVENGAAFDSQSSMNGYLLQTAVSMNDLGIVRFLIDNGVNVNLKFEYSLYWSAFRATHGSKRRVERPVIENRANENTRATSLFGVSSNALHDASSKGHLEISQFLVGNGADVNAQGGKYGNALQAAVSGSHLNVAQFLVKNGAIGSA